MRWRRLARGATVFLASLVAACEKDAPVAARALRASLQVNATLASAGEQVDVDVGYARTGAAAVRLTRVQVPATGSGRLDIPIEIDLTACLGDATRVGGALAGCPLIASIVLRDLNGIALDSTAIGPFDVREGATVSPTAPITLQAAATLTVESGDQQLGWNGEALHVPVVVRLTDRAGGAIAGRAVVVTPSGGGGVLGSGAQVTDSGGRVRINYRLGPALGAQAFQVGVPVGSATVTTTVALTAVEVRRERVVTGVFFSCGIAIAGTQCWGANDAGTLGNRTIAVPGDTVFPARISPDPGFISLTANKANNVTSGNVCGLTSLGDAYCWGLSPTSVLGPAATDICVPFNNQVPCLRAPTLVASGRNFRIIDVGGMNTPVSPNFSPERLCGVTLTGDAYCWGENSEGAVGNGTVVSPTSPVLVVGGHKWIDVSTGAFHTCGVTVFAQLYCWGRNDTGTLGTGDTVSSATPRLVASTERFRLVDAAWINSCALTLSGGLRCWGRDQVAFPSGVGGFGNALSPTAPTTNLPALDRLTVGTTHGCATTSAGSGYCWGRNRSGVLGDGTPVNAAITYDYAPVRVRSVTPFSEIAAGILHTCGLTQVGDTFCWGQATRGALGNGSRTQSASVPSRVTSSPPVAGAPAQLLLQSQMPRWAVRGGTCPAPLSAIVVDANGYPVAGAAVQFVAQTVGAGVAASSATTNTSGVATVNCTVSPSVGENRFVLRVSTLPLDSLIVTTNGQVPGPPQTVFCRLCNLGITAVVGVPTVMAGAAVQVLDSLGLPVQGVPVTFSRVSVSATTFVPVLPFTQATNANGEAQVSIFTPDTLLRTDSVRAVVSALPNLPQLIVVGNRPDAPTTSRFVINPSAARVGQALTPAITVSLFDRYGNFASNAGPRTVLLALTGGSGTLAGTTSVATVSGTATFTNLTVSAPGTYQLLATVSGFPIATSQPFTITP